MDVLDMVAFGVISVTEAKSMSLHELRKLYNRWTTLRSRGVI